MDDQSHTSMVNQSHTSMDNQMEMVNQSHTSMDDKMGNYDILALQVY